MSSTRSRACCCARSRSAKSSFGSIAGQLLQLSLEGKPLDSTTIAARHYLDMTAAEIQAAFQKYLRPDAFVTAVKGPAPKQ